MFKLDNVGLQTKTPTGETRWRLKDISLQWSENEQIGLTGKNGSGKSSLIRLLGGLEVPTHGRIWRQDGRKNITVIFQRPDEHFHCETVGKQIHSYSSSLGYAEVMTIIKQVGLPEDVVHYPPLRLSSGHQRLVAIACALASRSKFILMDEPMAGLDAPGRQLVRKTLQQMQQANKLSWLIVSHHPDDLFGLVDRLLIIDQGSLVYDGKFVSAPTDKLSLFLNSEDFSVYYRFRHNAEQGLSFPDEIYAQTTARDLASVLSKKEQP